MDEDEYYLLLALLNGSANNSSPNEAEGQLVEEVAKGQEDLDDSVSPKTGRPQRKRKKTSNNVFLFY